MTEGEWVFFAVAVGVALVLGILSIGVNNRQDGRIKKLQAQVACLQHPTHGESSVLYRKVGNRYVVVRPPVTTEGC